MAQCSQLRGRQPPPLQQAGPGPDFDYAGVRSRLYILGSIFTLSIDRYGSCIESGNYCWWSWYCCLHPTARNLSTDNGTGGIGSAIGKLLHGEGAKLALLYAPFEADRVKPTISETYAGASPNAVDSVKAYECDITSPDSVQQAFSAIAKEDAGFPSILVNSAGYVNLSPLEHTPPEDALRHYMINLFGPTLTSQAFARMYIAARERAKDAAPVGRIVNLASQAAHVALHHHGAYCASKAGLVGLTRSMASEWGPLGITSNSVSPGPVWTTMGKKAWADQKQREEYQATVPTGKFAEPDEVAKIVQFLVKDSSLNINGCDVRLDGGYTVR